MRIPFSRPVMTAMKRKELPFPAMSAVNTPLEQAIAANLVSDMNLLRLKATARLLARGLEPEVQWWDLLQEAFARVLNGSRRIPPEVPIDAFMTGVMRSIRAECWRRRSRHEDPADPRQAMHELDPVPDPERAALAQEELESIERLFADDREALSIVEGLADGLSAEEIRSQYGIPKTAYDSARKRMRRALLREGLRWKGL
jgi:DNA-directed RNA polymerase specialized sigma24 family protein